MKVFILEDCIERMKWFNKELVGCEITHSETAIQAIELLTSNKYDRIFLDHDLGGEQMVDGELVSNTGLAVSKSVKDIMKYYEKFNKGELDVYFW